MKLTARYDQLSEDTNVPPNIVLVKEPDGISGPELLISHPRFRTVRKATTE